MWFSREETILSKFSRFFIPLKFVSEEKIFQLWKLKLLTQFSNTRHSFIIPHETNFSSRIVRPYFQSNLKKYILESNETCFFMIQKENPIIRSRVQFFSFWSNFHCPCMILAVQPFCQGCEFEHFLNLESHENWESSTRLINMRNQASEKFSSLVIFKLSSCDSSPSLITNSWQIFGS